MVRSSNLIQLLVLGIFYCCSADKIEYTNCTDTDPKGLCTVTEIRVDPCQEATSKKPCNLRRGKSFIIQIDFIALKAIDSFKSKPYWASLTDLPFAGMNETGCAFTQCPIAQNEARTYNYKLDIARSLPRGKFDTKWKFWEDESDVGCCARLFIKLV